LGTGRLTLSLALEARTSRSFNRLKTSLNYQISVSICMWLSSHRNSNHSILKIPITNKDTAWKHFLQLGLFFKKFLRREKYYKIIAGKINFSLMSHVRAFKNHVDSHWVARCLITMTCLVWMTGSLILFIVATCHLWGYVTT